MACNSGWTLSSSDDEESSLLPVSQSNQRFASPCRIKEKLDLKNSKQAFDTKNSKPPCPFGSNCYRKNQSHFMEYSHPEQIQSNHLLKTKSSNSSPFEGEASPSKKMKFSPVKTKIEESKTPIGSSDPVATWNSSSPHYFLLTTCKGIPKNYNYISSLSEDKLIPPSLGIRDILSEKFGKLKQSAQFNYCIDIEWLMDKYPESFRSKPLLVVHGEQGGGATRLNSEAKPYPNIELCRVDLPPYGTHHTKMMFLLYEKGLRVVVSTANLVPQDWSQKSQGFYMSPIFPPQLGQGSDSEFKKDLIDYLSAYKKSSLNVWLEIIKRHDMLSATDVRLIGSVPGRHSGSSISSWGHMRLRKILKNKVKRIDSSWPVIGQFSSIGSLGPNEDKWLCEEWLASLSSCNSGKFLGQTSTKAPLKLIFPSVDNVRCSLEGYPAGGSLPYSSANAAKQKWLERFLHQWKSDIACRSEASPHIKSYTRISPFDTNIRAPWFLLTSANLSKAAWGALEKKSSQLAIKSYELGVLFLPNAAAASDKDSTRSVSSDSYFHINSNDRHKNRFSLPYSLPLTPYAPDDQPWTWDGVHSDAPDRHGNVWMPS